MVKITNWYDIVSANSNGQISEALARFAAEQFRGLHIRVAVEPALDDSIPKQVPQREQAHSLVVSHEGTHDGEGLLAALPCRRVVDGFEKAEAAHETVVRQTLQVGAGGFGRDHQRRAVPWHES